MSVRLHDALEHRREEEANEIQTIMRGENQRSNWRSIDREMGKTRTPAPIMVETVDEDGKVTQHRTKDEVEHAIHNEIIPRFSRQEAHQYVTTHCLNCWTTMLTQK